MDQLDSWDEEEYIDEQCLDGKCPICSNVMYTNNFDGEENFICKNNCYYYSINEYLPYRYVIDYRVFNRSWNYKEKTDYTVINEVIETIRYWKENDRYLVELMSL